MLKLSVVIWIERKAGAVWAVGRAVNPHLRDSHEPRKDDYVFEGYELEDALVTERRHEIHGDRDGEERGDDSLAAVALPEVRREQRQQRDREQHAGERQDGPDR